MDCTIHNTTAVILAAGSSGRMGIPKALLKSPEGLTFLETEVSVFLESGLNDVVVVVNPTVYNVLEFRKPWFHPQLTLVVNTRQEMGRLYSINLGLERVPDHSFAFIQNVDQPFLTPDIMRRMMQRATPSSFVVPAFEGNSGHPLLCGPAVVASILDGWAQAPDLRTLLEISEKEVVNTTDAMICENINTPEDYFRVFGKMPQ